MADVLTDTELVNAFDRAAAADGFGPYGLRAVERAVVAKMEGRPKWMDAYLRAKAGDGGFVTEADARKRERAAWDAYYAWGATCGLGIECDCPTAAKYRAERDRRYPLPTRPRTIPLSSGELACAGGKRDGEWYVRLNCTSVLTARDIAALAELVAKPTEPCE